MRIKSIIEYDGTNFCGWQVQPGLRTVQCELETAILKLTGERLRVTASGRTDAGVHALGQTVHFDINKDLGDSFMSGLNYYLPEDVRIMSLERVDESFHARFSSKKKTYIYVMYEGSESALLRNRAVNTGKLDVAVMNEAAKVYLGENDFVSFKSVGSDALTSIRTVYDSEVFVHDGLIIFSVTANGFLYKMVRKMVAALIEVGKGRSNMSAIKDMLYKKAEFTKVAPAHGLYLYKVEYDL